MGGVKLNGMEGKPIEQGVELPQRPASILVSHSHHDLEIIRPIHNDLEWRGHNPLLFFLKCLDDDLHLPNLSATKSGLEVPCSRGKADDKAWRVNFARAAPRSSPLRDFACRAKRAILGK